MTCEAVRDHLLHSDRIDHPGTDAAHHLLGCPACRAWHYRLTRLDRQLARLPAPASEPPGALLAMFRQGGPVLVRVPKSGEHRAARAKEIVRRKLAFAAALAAALAIFAVGLWSLPQKAGHPAAPRSELAALLREEPAVAKAPNLQGRLVALTDLAEKALADAGHRLDDAAHVARAADRFDRLVREALLRHAHELPGDIRAGVLHQLAERFRAAESQALRLGAAAKGQAGTVAALGRIATTARAADLRLRELARAV